MTSDYVDAVLFQLRWEAIDDRDGYFMGCYDTPEPSDDESDDEFCLATSWRRQDLST